MFNSNIKIILASSSPRRKELLQSLGLKFDIVIPNIQEQISEGQSFENYVCFNSYLKAKTVYEQVITKYKNIEFIIIGADTVVVLENKLFEKPKNNSHAKHMLKTLSNKAHHVLSGLSVIYHIDMGKLKEKTICVKSKVYMKKLTDKEIDKYISSGEPMDKAGAYAVQGIGAYMIEKIEGSYTNVVGLPLCELVKILVEDFSLNII